MPNIQDYTGIRFGTLIALAPTAKKWRNYIVWKMLCDCGQEREAVPSRLKPGSKCFLCAPFKRSGPKLPKGHGARNEILRGYKRISKNRNLDFLLTDQQAHDLFESDCYYCGSGPSNYRKPDRQKYNGGYYYNGIDRLDNSRGYDLKNCVPCCVICNKAKRDIPLEDFMGWIEKLITHKRSAIHEIED